MDDTTHRELADWLNQRGVTAIYEGTGGGYEIVVVDAPSLPVILAYTPGGDEAWGGWEYPRRADGDAYRAFWEGEGEPLPGGDEPPEDAPVEVVGAWILATITGYTARA